MSKLSDHAELEQRGLDAVSRLENARNAIVTAACAVVAAPTGPRRVALWEPLERAVRVHEHATEDLRVARELLDERARSR